MLHFVDISVILLIYRHSFLYNGIAKSYTKEECLMKEYYNQEKISSSLMKFFQKIFNLSKPHLKNIAFIIAGMVSAESVVTSDISRKLKDDFSTVLLESVERRFRRFFNSFSSIAYLFFDAVIVHVISKFCVKHSDNKVHISFDHMFCKDKFTILLFSLRIGKQRNSYLVQMF